MKHLAPADRERNQYQDDCHGDDDRPTEDLVDRTVNEVLERFTSPNLEVLSNPVEDDYSIREGISS